ncbi:MAG: hypothetical protein JXA78_01130 [Anaerolineales bacterium]|nr:hypothetical protein [Anaerolineales bacterium]
MKHWVSRLASHENFPILILMLFNLAIGFAVVTHYGESWDERSHYKYGFDSLLAYLGNSRAADLKMEDKGPAYAMLGVAGAKALQALYPGWQTMEAWHFVHFLSFLLGLFFLYRLCLRVAGKWAALGATLLFNTQPLLWGHAFINPKDISFMAFFLGSLELGLGIGQSTALLEAEKASLARRLGMAIKDWRVILAAVFLGLASAMRVLGPAAGLLVGAYLLIKHGRRALPALVIYLALTAVVIYIAWPGLWRSPVMLYLKALRFATSFPWEGKVLYNQVEYGPEELPRSYLPTLLALQFTEPMLLLFLFGLGAAVLHLLRGKPDRWLIGLLAAWLFIPILSVVITQPKMYDNFRQFFFVIPPIFVFAAVGLQRLVEWLRRPVLYALALALLAAPGVYALLQLHPYQYLYYNSLTGGVEGAFRRYETDYWLTSYRDATLYLNDIAVPEARVVVWGALHLVKRYNRDDMTVLDYSDMPKNALPEAEYAIISSRHSKDQTLYPGAPLLYQVRLGGVVLAVVKDLRPPGSNP